MADFDLLGRVLRMTVIAIGITLNAVGYVLGKSL